MVADDNALGSGIAISNEEFLTPFTPLTGTINVTGNSLIRAGAYNPNWDHPMGAVQFDSYDSAFSGVTVNYSGDGYDSGTYMPGAFTFNLGSGNSGWSTTPVLTSFPSPVQPGALHASPTSLSFGDVASGSTSSAQTVTVSNPGTSAASVSSVSVSGPFSQTNTCGSSIAAGGTCTVSVKFAPTSGGAATGTLTIATSAPGSPLTVALSGTGTSSTTDLALNKPVTASSYT